MGIGSLARNRLDVLVDSFDRDPAAARESIRSLMEREPQTFQEGFLPVLRRGTSPRGIQFVVGLVVGSDHLFQAVCDPALTFDEACSLARTAVQVDPCADVNLARRLADEALNGISSAAAGRLLAILTEISSGARLMPSLMRLMRLSDPQIRSKVVLMIGRANGSLKWIQGKLTDPDPRTRGSAVEALWGNGSPEARELLHLAARDSNNRVAANALYGLYILGETSTLMDLIRMGAHHAPLVRASAAWAMGQTADRRFADVLGRMMCDGNAIVRKRAFSALNLLRTAAAQARSRTEWRVTARLIPSLGGVRQLLVEVAPPEGGALPRLLATQFELTEGKQPVYVYQVESRSAPDSLAVSFLAPRTGDNGGAEAAVGVANCLKRKRPSDLWRVTQYIADASHGSPAPEISSFTSNGRAALAVLEKPVPRSQCPGFWRGLLECVRASAQPARGIRRLMVCCRDDPGQPPSFEAAQETIAAAINAQVSVLAVAGSPNMFLEEICRRTRGSFEIAGLGQDLATLMEESYQILLARFLISYQPITPGAETLYLWVSNGAAWGEATICL